MKPSGIFNFEDKSKLGTLLFLSSESVFFVFLIVAYAFYNYGLKHGPTAAASLHPLLTGLYSIALFASSGTIWLGLRQLRRGNHRHFKIWLGATILLGIIFLLGQAHEYYGLIESNVTISRNLFGTSFFTLTGFHGIHVLIGIVLLLILFPVSARAEHYPQLVAVECISYYWHFVDGVWVVIFSIVYLWTAHGL